MDILGLHLPLIVKPNLKYKNGESNAGGQPSRKSNLVESFFTKIVMLLRGSVKKEKKEVNLSLL